MILNSLRCALSADFDYFPQFILKQHYFNSWKLFRSDISIVNSSKNDIESEIVPIYAPTI